ncbi:MAG: GNAT family N-acetyltransferase [Alphaproteobacteria bacterium]|nr:GNAT family N-acetyltransferase [Alphaproteobacteria bacterium]
MRLRRAGEGDIAFLMEAERGEGYERLVGQSGAAQHRAWLADPAMACLIAARDGEADGGFILLSGLGNVHDGVCMKRIVAARPDGGFGTAMVRAGLDWVFGETEAPRVWLDTLRHNTRAAHVYRKVGFVEEGVFRAAYRMPDGSRADRIVFGMLRPEWQALRDIPAVGR